MGICSNVILWSYRVPNGATFGIPNLDKEVCILRLISEEGDSYHRLAWATARDLIGALSEIPRNMETTMLGLGLKGMAV